MIDSDRHSDDKDVQKVKEKIEKGNKKKVRERMFF